MGAGVYIPRDRSKIRLEPITGKIGDFENRFRQGEGADVEHGALYDANGEPIVGYLGTRHNTPIDERVLNMPGGTFSHFHPDKAFGGTLSLADLSVFAKSQLNEMRAVAKQGQLYTLKANDNVDRAGLAKWVKRVEPIAVKNFNNSYKKALKAAVTPLKSGPHKGQIKITNPTTGKAIYRQPMTAKQAQNFARQYSVGAFERMYKKNLAKFGVEYKATKGRYASTAR